MLVSFLCCHSSSLLLICLQSAPSLSLSLSISQRQQGWMVRVLTSIPLMLSLCNINLTSRKFLFLLLFESLILYVYLATIIGHKQIFFFFWSRLLSINFSLNKAKYLQGWTREKNVPIVSKKNLPIIYVFANLHWFCASPLPIPLLVCLTLVKVLLLCFFHNS